MRLDHFLALANIGTKNKTRELIYQNQIKVNEAICAIPSTQVDSSKDTISYQGKQLAITPVYYALHKPQNCLTARDPHAFTVFDCVKEVDQDGLFAVGRLDKDTEGLIFLTNDGNFSNQLMAPDRHIPKTYFFLCLGVLSSDKIQTLESGMDIGDGITTKPAQIRLIKSGLYTDLSAEIGIEKIKRIKKQPANQQAFMGEIIISEGKKHQVKRMLRGINCPVIYLKRIAIGDFQLPDIKVGEFIAFDYFK